MTRSHRARYCRCGLRSEPYSRVYFDGPDDSTTLIRYYACRRCGRTWKTSQHVGPESAPVSIAGAAMEHSQEPPRE